MNLRPGLLAILLVAPTMTAAEPPGTVFDAWRVAVDAFLGERMRYSEFSEASRSRWSSFQEPSERARFERLIESLPPASQWGTLADQTRARLPKKLPGDEATLRAWWDAHLLHLWALMLRLPESPSELRATLDRVRTVRWLLQEDMIPVGGRGSSVAGSMQQVEESLRAYVAEHDGSPELAPESAFEKALEQASRPLRERAVAHIGEEALAELEGVAARRQKIEDVRGVKEEAEQVVLGDFRMLTEIAERYPRDSPEVREAIRIGEAHQESLRKAAADLDDAQTALRLGRKEAPEWEACFDLGPLPPCVIKHLRPEDRDAEVRPQIAVPDLVAICGEARALDLLARASKAPVDLEWSQAGSAGLAAAHWIAAGRLELAVHDPRDPHPAVDLMRTLTAQWPEPMEGRAKAVLALADWLEKHAGDDAIAEYGMTLTAGLARWRGIARIASGKPDLVSALYEEKEGSDYHGFEVLEQLPSSCAPWVARFLERFLESHKDRDLRDWEMMQRFSARAGRADEALRLLERHQAELPSGEDLAQLLLKSRMDAGGKVGAAAIQAMLASPLKAEKPSTAQRTEGLRRLYELGETHARPEWRQRALQELQRLVAHWSRGSGRTRSDGGDPWSRLPGWLAGLGRLELAQACAELNVRWSVNHADAMRWFLNSVEDEERARQAPASALAGLAQIQLQRKNPRAVMELLATNPHWPAGDLAELLDIADPSFPEGDRLTLREIAARALELTGRRAEALRVRNAVSSDGWRAHLRQRLDDPESLHLSPAEVLGGRMILGPVSILEGTIEPSLSVVASALDKVDLPSTLWDAPPQVFRLKAVFTRLNRERKIQEAVRPRPHTPSFRAFVLASVNSLKPIRDALLDNVP